ncbi:hypothetical protein ACLB2K_076649 [Fragaria x ananassa]
MFGGARLLDVIWALDAWNSFKGGFSMNEETESRILLTTRNGEIASLARGNNFLYESRALRADESWNLFRKIAISEVDDPNSQSYSKKEELGKSMLQHYVGLPLAIIVLTGLLARKDTIDEWKTVHKNVDVYIRRGRDLEQEYKGQKYEGASWVLALSYDNLPYCLKLCFLYLGNFPEDYEIPVKRLTQLWMAEGFISTTSEMMEDVSYNCFSELVERCMVQVGDVGSSGKIKSCHLHDLMRDLCLLKAKEENFVHIVNLSANMRIRQVAPIGKVRRLAIYWRKRDNVSTPTRDGHLRISGEKLSLATLCDLRTLVNVDSEESDLNDVAELSNLTKLYIRAPAGSKHLEKLDEILKSRSITFNHLQSLTLTVDQSGGDIVLRFPFIYKLRLLGLITRLPAELSYYPNLVKMKLFGTHLEEDQIELLEKLPKLRVLYLDFRVFGSLPSNTLVCSGGGFPRLELLSIRFFKELQEWTMEEGAVPCLSRLIIESRIEGTSR